MAQHLRAAGLHPLLANSAEEALRIATEERPALITLDNLLPTTDEATTLERLKRDPATAAIPVVVVSIDDDRARSLALGAAAHLTKPVTRESVHEVVRSVGIAPRPVVGRRVLVVGRGDELDRVAEGLVEAGAKVDRRPSIALGDSLDCDVAVVDADQDAAAAFAARPAHPPMLAIVDEAPDSQTSDVSFLSRRELRAPDVVSRVHQSILPASASPPSSKDKS